MCSNLIQLNKFKLNLAIIGSIFDIAFYKFYTRILYVRVGFHFFSVIVAFILSNQPCVANLFFGQLLG